MTGSAPPTDTELLAHAGFVRGLARALAGGEADADDLAQDAWVAAFGSRPASGANVRGWLATVLRNLARMRRRSARRRLDREIAAARADRAPSARETAARLEIQRRLVAAVTGLDEPFRTAVVLRHFDGLAAPEIARRLGVPVKTVHSRLTRARDRLRTSLDGEYGGNRAAWRAAILPLAGLRAGRAAAAGTLVAGGVLMGVKAQVALVALALAATLTAVLVGVGPGDAPDAEPPVQTARAPETPDVPEAATPDRLPGTRAAAARPDPTAPVPGSAEPAVPPAAAETTKTARLVVTVLAPDGSPAVGAQVKYSTHSTIERELSIARRSLAAMEVQRRENPDRAFSEESLERARRRIEELAGRRFETETVADSEGKAVLDVPPKGLVEAARSDARGRMRVAAPPRIGEWQVVLRLEPPDPFGPPPPDGERIGGGAGGVFGGRGGHRNLRAEGGGATTENGVNLGLEWLKNHVTKGAGWDVDGFGSRCVLNPCEGPGHPDADAAITGLALLAFSGAGETHRHGKYKRTVAGALAWLLGMQDEEGRIGAPSALGRLNQAIPTQALAEAWVLVKSSRLGEGAQRGVDRLAAGASDGPWTDEEALWTEFALRSAKAAGLKVDEKLAARVAGRLDSPSPTDRHPDPADVVAWHFGTLAAFQAGGERWKEWNPAMKKALLGTQRKDGDEKGSWDPTGPDGALLGRVGTTAIAVATLETYYRYARSFLDR